MSLLMRWPCPGCPRVGGVWKVRAPYSSRARRAITASPSREPSMMPAFVPDLSVILAFAAATVVLAITPGPDMALQMSRAVNYGRIHGMAAMFGAMTGILVHTILVAFGISVLIVAAPPLFLALKIAGALYLLWLAYQAMVHGGGLRLSEPARRPPRVRKIFTTGVSVILFYSMVVLFFITFLPNYVDAHDPAATG